MPTGPVVTVTTTELPSATGVSLNTGTAFVVGKASYGPEVATLVKGLKEVVALYGPRKEAESTELYDGMNTFFATGGSRAYINRILGAGKKTAELELEAGATAKTLKAEAKYPGTFGNSIKIEVVENAGKTESQIIFLNEESEVLEKSPLFAKASEILAWGEETAHKTFVILKEGASYAAGKGSVLKVLAATKLAGGVNPTVTEGETKVALEGFAKTLGPGQIFVPEKTNGVKEAVHKAMGELAQKNNRIALCDLKEAEKEKVTVATLTGEKGTYTAAISQYMAFFSSTAIVQGVTVGTTRTVPASPVVAGLCATVAQTNNDATNPSGKAFPLGPYVTGFTNLFKQAEIEELAEKQINSFNEVQGIPCLWGFESALSKEKDLIFWQASVARERMSLTGAAEAIGQNYLFKLISKKLIARFQGDLQALGAKHQKEGALFGETPAEAVLVNVGEPINTPTTMAAGELNAEMLVRISPYANVVAIVLVSVPVSEAV